MHFVFVANFYVII